VQQLAEALDEYKVKTGKAWKLNPGDGAFYGPKIDIHISDALKRSFQCATIQLDFNLPIRFNLEFMSESGEASVKQSEDEDGHQHPQEKEEDGEKCVAPASSSAASARVDRPVIIHRAILGSVERMIAILIEHTAGKWPFWLSPRQVVILPVSDKFNDYAHEVRKVIHAEGFYVDVDDSDKKLQKKIALSQLDQYNYILVVGEQEKNERSVNVRTRDNVVHGTKKLEEIVAEFQKLAKEFK